MANRTDRLEQQIETAADALSPFYEEGDDGDAIRMSLDSIASVCGFGGINELTAGMDEELRSDVKKLYELAKAGEYGTGLTEEDAQEINDIVEGVADRLKGYARNVRSKRHHRRTKPEDR
jgi:hypothetical protein